MSMKLLLHPSSKVFVYAPFGVVTGGAELLHQLVSALRDTGIDAYIVYFGGNGGQCPSDYLKYNLAVCETIEDNERNVLVIYEGIFEKSFPFAKIQKVFWWLSVDNFYYCELSRLPIMDLFSFNKVIALRTMMQRIKHPKMALLVMRERVSISRLKSASGIHSYQSEYARHFLEKKGFRNIYALKDYINLDHFNGFDIHKKQDIVLYNPKKGFEFTKRLMESSPDILWSPIINLSREEVINLMQKSKVYVDFGYHPGKDRLPRECAMNGCCIVTGKKGSAGYQGDVNIPDKYKFEELKDVTPIIATIRHLLANYEDSICDYAQYRECICSEKEEFFNHVEQLFTIH